MAQTAKKEVMDKATEQAYDNVPYESYAYPMTFPAHIGMVGSLFGLNTAAPQKARILEIGSASGGNVFPLALRYPNADITAIDLSDVQIAEAKKQQEVMGVKNIKFIAMDACKIDKSFGKFDYIICHGVFSWVPDEVRDRLLEVFNEHLNDNGVAFVSYNTLPGWQFVQSLRDMMRYHIERFETPREKVAQAKMLLEFLRESAPANREWYKNIIQEELNIVAKANDTYFFHDHLEGNNTQYYLHQFVDMARKANLQYLGDANLPSMFVENMPKNAAEKLRSVNDIVRQEQYMDFIVNRRFRMSLLIKGDAKLQRNIPQEKVFDFYLSSAMRPKNKDADKNAPFDFEKMDGGGTFTTNNPPATTLFLTLCEQGIKPIKAEDLIKETMKKLGTSDDTAIRKIILDFGVRLALHGYISFSADTLDFVKNVSEKPKAYPLARYQAQQPNVKIVTNVAGTAYPIDAVGMRIMTQLDGTKTKAEIVDALVAEVLSGKLNIKKEDKQLTEEAEIKEALTSVATNILEKCANSGLLVA